MSKRPRVPKPSCHKSSGLAFVKHKGKFTCFGKFGTDWADEGYTRQPPLYTSIPAPFARSHSFRSW